MSREPWIEGGENDPFPPEAHSETRKTNEELWKEAQNQLSLGADMKSVFFHAVEAKDAEIARLKEKVDKWEATYTCCQSSPSCANNASAKLVHELLGEGEWTDKHDRLFSIIESIEMDRDMAKLRTQERDEKLLSQAAHIDLLRGALEPFAITLGSPDSNRRIRPDEDVAIGVKASDVFGAIEALSASADSGLEEVRGLVKALEEIANRVNNEGDDSQATVADCGHIAREALAAHQKRGK